MKRSKTIGLVAMSASIVALTACEEPAVDAAVFETLSQCLANGDVDRSQCEADFKAAKEQHAKVAPKYTSQADCEADFGAEQCESAPYQTQSGGSVFMPLMMGYMMGNVDADTLNIIYNLADVLNKIAFGLIIWHVAVTESKVK